jgi:hypothetical protein
MKESVRGGRWRQDRGAGPRRKKTAEAIHREVAQEVDLLLQAIFRDRRQSGRLDLEVI